MRTRNLKKPYYLIAIILILLPIITVGGFLLFINSAIKSYLSFNDNLCYENYIDGLKDANFTLLEQRSAQYEERLQKYHLPNDTILSTLYEDDNLTIPKAYSVTEDSPIWTGSYLAAQAFRWAVANRTGDIYNQTNAEAVIFRVIKAFGILLEITGTPGALARYACYGSQENYENGLWDNDSILVTQGKYTGWRYISFISKDQLNGVFFGYGTVYSLVQNASIRSLIAQHVDMMITHFEYTHWQGINDDGTMSVRFVPYEPYPLRTPSGSSHILSYLIVGRLINFTKYDPMYRKYAIDRNYAYKTYEDVSYNIINSYFGININVLPMYSLIDLESDPKLRSLYLESFNQSIYQVVKYHRNSFYKIVYLSLAKMTRADAPMVIRDILDNLQRFAESKYPYVARPILNSKASDYDKIVDPISVEWNQKMQTLEKSIYYIQRYAKFSVHTKDALPIDRRQGGSFLWQNSPFILDSKTNNTKYEQSGVDYLIAYWMGRYYNYIPNALGAYV